METVHIFKRSSKINYHVILLLLPIIIFGLVLILYLMQLPQERTTQVATTVQEPTVLGEQDKLDNPQNYFQNK